MNKKSKSKIQIDSDALNEILAKTKTGLTKARTGLAKTKDGIVRKKDDIMKSDIMKTKNCCICGEKITFAFMAEHIGGGAKSDDLLLCKKCYARLQELRFGRNIERNVKYFETFAPKIKNKVIKDHIKKTIADGKKEKASLDELKRQKKMAIKKRQTDIREIILTTGSNVEGWRITEYLGLVSTEVALGMGYFDKLKKRFGKYANPPPEPIWEIMAEPRQAAISRLRVVGVDKGANAIIGMTVDYTVIGETILAVIVSGTAVKAERLDESQEGGEEDL